MGERAVRVSDTDRKKMDLYAFICCFRLRSVVCGHQGKEKGALWDRYGDPDFISDMEKQKFDCGRSGFSGKCLSAGS